MFGEALKPILPPPQSPQHERMREKQITIGIIVFVSAVCLGFAIYTRHVWEDYWITFRCSRNLATGQGLVYTPGERLHSFTSPLGVLLPAAFSWMTGNDSDDLVLWLFRLVSIAALAWGMVLLFRVLQQVQSNRIAVFFPLALIGLDSKVVDFSINGMETGLLIFFLALTIHGLLIVGRRQWWRIGVGWAGLMWTRPDSCVYIAAASLAVLCFPPGPIGRQTRKAWLKNLLMAGSACGAIYLPWFLWAWGYYGSPIPHTIVAKSVNMPPLSASGLLIALVTFPLKILSGGTDMAWVFLPSYSLAWFTEEHRWFIAASFVFGVVAAFAWVVPLFRPQTRLFSLMFFLGNYYLTAVVKTVFPWYQPPVAIFGYLTVGLVLDQILDLMNKGELFRRSRGWVARLPGTLRPGIVIAITVLILGQLTMTLWEARLQCLAQQLIENDIRRPIGLWLRAHARTPHDTVMLEPLGYIGYYSGLKMLDYPGLASKEMVATRRKLGKARENQVFLELKPDWLVLRRVEIEDQRYGEAAQLGEWYDPVQAFDGEAKMKAIHWFPGRTTIECDAQFLIFCRKSKESATTTR
jgi:hypothetical protein